VREKPPVSPRVFQCERCGGMGVIHDGGLRWDWRLGRSREYAPGETCDSCDGAGVLGPIPTEPKEPEVSSDPTRYPPDYAAELKLWAVRSAAVLLLSVAVALVNRYLGVSVEVPPPPPVTVVVQPQDGGEPKVTVYNPVKVEK
jgi:hypothetical protein